MDSADNGDNFDEDKSAFERNTIHLFHAPFELAKGADLSSLLDEIEEVVEYSRKYFNLDKESYKRVWFRLHTTPDSSK